MVEGAVLHHHDHEVVDREVAAAGQVLRGDLEPGRLVSKGTPTLDQEFAPGRLDRAEKRAPVNVRYVAELVALRRGRASALHMRAVDDVRLQRLLRAERTG